MQYIGSYLIRGNEHTLKKLVDTLEKEQVTSRGSSDLYVRTYRKFGVDEAEDLRARARSKSTTGGHRIFAFFAPSMTIESQNALLKTLEEPSSDALFFLVTPSPEILLPTIRSRVQTIDIKVTETEGMVNIDEFLKATPDERITLMKPLYDYDEDEGRDIAPIIGFLQSLEIRFGNSSLTPNSVIGLQAIYRAKKYATDKGSLLKPLLEQVALLVPRM